LIKTVIERDTIVFAVRLVCGLAFVVACNTSISFFIPWWFDFDTKNGVETQKLFLLVNLFWIILFLVYARIGFNTGPIYWASTLAIYFAVLNILELGVGHRLCFFGSDFCFRREHWLAALLVSVPVSCGYWLIAGRHAGLWKRPVA
jgi:hypothetical protein